MKKKLTAVTLTLLTAAVLLTSCGSAAKLRSLNEKAYNPQNEIISNKPIDLEKTVIVAAQYGKYDLSALEEAIEVKFPDIDIVFVQVSAGTQQAANIKQQLMNGAAGDLVIGSTSVDENLGEYFYDLSGCDFINNYSLASLRSKSIDGKIYQLPISNSGFGIFYNKTLFDERGWSVPETKDEFFTLCEEISAEGIRPFVPCFKYETTISAVALGLSIDEMLSDSERIGAFYDYLSDERKGEGKGVIEPMLETQKELFNRGIVNEDDYSSSATKNRKALYAGEIAMIPYNFDFNGFYSEEKPDCEIGFFGFPTETPGERWVLMSYGSGISLTKQGMNDETKHDKLLAIMEFISTTEGQDAVFTGITGVSALKVYENKTFSNMQDLNRAMEGGRVFFWQDMSISSVALSLRLVKNEITTEEYVNKIDENRKNELPKEDLLEREPIGSAERSFTMLETSIYNAEVMRRVSGAQIALIPHGEFYKGNIARIFEGGVNLPELFVLKAITEDDCLTVYNITGENLKKLLERPIIDGAEQNFLYAFSGLKVTYAPWSDSAENLLSVTLADGTEIEDNKIYTVAAWATSIDEGYIDNTARALPEVGMNADIMKSAIEEAGTIAPIEDGRLTLEWNVAPKE